MYLVSTDYLNSKSKCRLPTQRKTRKKTNSVHPYEKWVATRGGLEEAAVGRKALMKAIADFVKAVLPETTLARPKTVSSVQTASSFSPSIAKRHLLMLSGEKEVFETGPGAADDVREVGEGDVRAYARKSFGKVARPYLAPFVRKRGVLDVDYGSRSRFCR